MSNTVKVDTVITQQPFRCVVCGYINDRLYTRRETNDPWGVMREVDLVHYIMRGQLPRQAANADIY